MKRSLLLPLAILLFASCSSAPKDKLISPSDFPNGEWPFTVSAGRVSCDGGAIVFEANGTKYAVNGTAEGRGFANIDPIWKPDPKLPGTKISIGSVIVEGQKLCQ